MAHVTINEMMRQHEFDFTAHAALQANEIPLASSRLLILGCSASKAEGNGLSALDRYTGPLWQTLKAVDPDGSMAQVAYLSAKFGLGDARGHLPLYTSLLTGRAADAMLKHGLCGVYPHYDTGFRSQAARDRHLSTRPRLQTPAAEICRLTRRAGRPLDDVAICGGKEYVRVARGLVAEMKAHGFIEPTADVTIINDQIGYMRASLRRWLTDS